MARNPKPDVGEANAIEDYFRRRVDNLKALLPEQTHLELAREGRPRTISDYELEVLLLACCYIDAVAGLFLDIEGSEKRFRELLWNYYDDHTKVDFRKINLPALRAKLQKYPDVDKKGRPRPAPLLWRAEKLLGWLENEISRSNYNVGDETQNDPLFEEVLLRLKGLMAEDELSQHWQHVEEMVKESTYAGVLYEQYRSSLVHEALVRGHWTWMVEDRPVYTAVEGGEIDLTFPTRFLVDTLEQVLSVIFSRYWTFAPAL